MMLPIGDNCVKCEAHSQNLVEVVDFEKMLLGDYDLHHPLSFSSPSVASLQTPALFSMCTSKRNLGNGDGLIYTGETRPALAEPTIAPDLEKWMAAQAPTIGYDGTLRSSKRLRTVTAGTHHNRLQYSVTPRKQPLKAPCRRSQKLGDKITALQQLVSPFGKTDTASVLQEAATCIRLLHEQIQILTAPYPGMSSSSFQQDTVEVTTDLRRRGLCLAPISTAVVSLVSESACDRRYTEMEDQRRWFGGV